MFVTGFKLYQDGTFACQVEDANATSMDCQVTLNGETASFTLTAAFADGSESPHSAPVTYTTSGTSPGDPSTGGDTVTPPTAVITSSTAAGAAPLQVSFNGSDSTPASGTTIVSYAWSFGDGASGSGAMVAHSFTAAGTYTATLTVTDSQGRTGTASTPVVVTAPVATTNKAPTAAATATPTAGTAPLTVQFDASASTDSDGSIASYLWKFGDGSTATGKTASHTYTTAADYTATLVVTDNRGATGTTSVAIKAAATVGSAELNIETGELSVGSNWVQVPISGNFNNPVVVAGPHGSNNLEPCVIRLRNVTPTGFEIRLEEWNYLWNRTHPAETVAYLVMEKGRTTLPDGSMVEAGSFAGGTASQDVQFGDAFNSVPVLMTTIASDNEPDTISGRLSNITTSGFSYMFREQERNWNSHARETVHFIAWEPGRGALGPIRYEVARATAGLTDRWTQITFNEPFGQAPLFLAHLQTLNETDTAALRARAVTPTGVPLKVEEEKSRDWETTHAEETVGYMAFDKAE
jgi:PKD repeat protein